MVRLILPITSLLAGVALLLLGTGLLGTSLALRGNFEGYNTANMGMIMSGYFVGFFIGTFAALPLVHRIGYIRTFAFCAALISCSALLHILFVNPWAWFLFRIATGGMAVVLYTVIEGWLNAQTPAEQRGRVFSAYMAVNLGALALSQQLINLASPEGFALFVVVAMLMSLSLAPVTLTQLKQPIVHDMERMRLRTVYAYAPVAVAASLLSGFAMGAFWGLGAVYADRIGLDTRGVSIFMSVAIVGGALGQLILGKYSDTHDRRRVLIATSLIAIVTAIALAFLSYTGLWVLLAIGLYGAAAFATYPLAIAHLVDHLPHEKILAGGSALLLIHGVGAAIGPAIAGQLMQWLGDLALPIYFAVVQAILVGFTANKIGHSQKLRDDLTKKTGNHTEFVPMLRTSPVALELMPEDSSGDDSEDMSGAQEQENK